MPFKKGQSGNPKGKPKGIKNKASGQLREMVTDFLEGEFETIKTSFQKLRPRDKVRFYTDLLQYGLPKLQASTLGFDFGNMKEEDLDKIIENLKKAANERSDDDN